MTTAIEVAEMFLEAGKLITYTEGRLRNQNMRFSAHAKQAYTASAGFLPPSRDRLPFRHRSHGNPWEFQGLHPGLPLPQGRVGGLPAVFRQSHHGVGKRLSDHHSMGCKTGGVRFDDFGAARLNLYPSQHPQRLPAPSTGRSASTRVYRTRFPGHARGIST